MKSLEMFREVRRAAAALAALGVWTLLALLTR